MSNFFRQIVIVAVAASTFAPVAYAVSSTPVPTPTPATVKSDYVLPYPGILPDHPLYMLKTMRDSILDFLITDPMKKAEFYILVADKHLNSGIFLLNKQKESLAAQSVTAAEQYMEKSVDLVTQAKEKGTAIPGPVKDKLTQSIAKHIQVLEQEMVSGGAEFQAVLTAALEKVKQLQNDVVTIQ